MSPGAEVDAVLDGYHAVAPSLIPRFETLVCADIYAPVHHLFPKAPSRVLDIGAGTGRDAAWFAAMGHSVVAVEPVAPLRLFGQDRHAHAQIRWIDDRLPDLGILTRHRQDFDLVLVSGVWHHLAPRARRAALPKLARLLMPGGHLVMSLRHGPSPAGRPAFAVTGCETKDIASAQGLRCVLQTKTPSMQKANITAGVTWTWLAFTARDRRQE